MESTEQEKLASILLMAESHERTAALASWFQGIFPPGSAVPILVGGAAVEILTGGAYTSGDLDFVGELPPEVVRFLEAAGFTRQGRHWLHEEGQVFMEFPGSVLEPEERAGPIRVGQWTVLILSPEDVLVDRLAAWQFWGSAVDGVAAFWILDNFAGRLEMERLRAAAERRNVLPAWENLLSLSKDLAGRSPEAEELFAWARTKP